MLGGWDTQHWPWRSCTSCWCRHFFRGWGERWRRTSQTVTWNKHTQRHNVPIRTIQETLDICLYVSGVMTYVCSGWGGRDLNRNGTFHHFCWLFTEHKGGCMRRCVKRLHETWHGWVHLTHVVVSDVCTATVCVCVCVCVAWPWCVGDLRPHESWALCEILCQEHELVRSVPVTSCCSNKYISWVVENPRATSPFLQSP